MIRKYKTPSTVLHDCSTVYDYLLFGRFSRFQRFTKNTNKPLLPIQRKYLKLESEKFLEEIKKSFEIYLFMQLRNMLLEAVNIELQSKAKKLLPAFEKMQNKKFVFVNLKNINFLINSISIADFQSFTPEKNTEISSAIKELISAFSSRHFKDITPSVVSKYRKSNKEHIKYLILILKSYNHGFEGHKITRDYFFSYLLSDKELYNIAFGTRTEFTPENFNKILK